MAERKKLEVTILPQNFTETQQEQARKNISAAAISATVSKIESSDGTVSAIPYTAEDGSIRYDLKVSATPVISDTEIYGTNGISAKNQGVKWTIGLSADYLSGNALDNLSGNWESSYNTLKSNSADWLKEDVLAGLATKTELNTASSVLTAQTDYLSGVINNKLDTSAFNTYTANADITPYSGIDPILVKDHTISLTAEYALSADVYSKDDINYIVSGLQEQLTNLGYYICGSDEIKSDPDRTPNEAVLRSKGKLSSSKIYLVQINTASTPDQYREWIWQDDTNTWICIGDTSINLNGYATETWVKDNYSAASALSAEFMKYLNKTDFNTYSADVKTQIDAKLDTNTFDAWSAHAFDAYAKTVDVNEQFNQTSAWAKDTFQPKGEYVSASDFNNLVGIVNDIVEDVTELDNTKIDTSAFNNYSAHALDDYYNKSKVDELVDDAIDDLSATVVDEYAKKTDIHEYTAGPNIEINDYVVSGRDWTLELDKKADITYVEDIVETLANGIAKKLDISAFDNYSAHALDNYYNKAELNNRFEPIETDIDILKTYSAHNTVESSNDYINVQSGANKFILTFTSGDLATKTWVESVLADFGGFEPAEPTGEDKHPDVTNPDNKKIYLVADNTAPNPDKSREWIVTGANTSTGWYCIGDTSLDLDPYLTKDDAAQTYQLKGDYLSANAFDNLSGNWESTYDTVNSNSATWEKVNDLYNVELSSTNDSIGITATTAVDGTVKYDLSVDKVTLPDISGENGISAYFDENESKYVVGLENYNDIGFAKYSTNSNTYTTSAVVTGYNEDLNVNPTKITLTNDQILLKTGFYHLDVQTNFSIANPDNNYYNVFVKSIPNAASITQMIDGSYEHTETIDLSFDVRITNDDTPIEISVENYKSGETFAISNLNIHEIVSMPSQIETDSNNYQAGDGISISNDTIEAKLGNGLEFNESNAIQVKLGDGLAFTDDQGIKAISIDPSGEVAEVVETVETLQDELDTKITDNFPPAMITLADLQVATGTEYAPSNGGMLIGYLFTCPITHNIYLDNDKYQTKIGIYTKQWSGTNNRVILGIYEYDPDYVNPNTQQVGKTEALCDTGIIELQQGYAEYEIKNVGEKTDSIMTPGKFYYATIYLSYQAGDTNGITLFGAPGYNTQVNNLKPGITITNVNKIKAALYENLQGYSPNLNFDQMGFSWQFDSYPPQEGTTYTSQNIVEAHAAGRPYFAVRNVKKVGN